MQLSNTVASLECASWMKSYFELCGDCIPNRNGEIHLDSMEINDVYAVYVKDIWSVSGEHLAIDAFRIIWARVYPHISIRPTLSTYLDMSPLFVVASCVQESVHGLSMSKAAASQGLNLSLGSDFEQSSSGIAAFEDV